MLFIFDTMIANDMRMTTHDSDRQHNLDNIYVKSRIVRLLTPSYLTSLDGGCFYLEQF